MSVPSHLRLRRERERRRRQMSRWIRRRGREKGGEAAEGGARPVPCPCPVACPFLPHNFIYVARCFLFRRALLLCFLHYAINRFDSTSSAIESRTLTDSIFELRLPFYNTSLIKARELPLLFTINRLNSSLTPICILSEN
ncbi:hypothetical protein COP1_001624 [Malus domestica]